MTGNRYFAPGRFAFVALLGFAFCFATATTLEARKRKSAKFGVVKLQTIPAGLPITLDEKPSGETTTSYREFNLEAGPHKIEISLPNGRLWTREIRVAPGQVKCLTLSYRPSQPVAESFCPFPIRLSGPTSVNEGEVTTYAADVSYTGTSVLSYTWTLSPVEAKILSGAGKPTITVDSTGLANQRITATLVVDDGSGEAACRQSAQVSTFVLRPPMRGNPARAVDVCCSCSYDDLKARLDNLAVELQNEPAALAHIIAYAGRTSRSGQADRLGSRAKDYLVTRRGIDSARIVMVNGGFKEEDCVELWVVPSGAQGPQPSPTVRAGDVHTAPDPVRRRRRG